MDRRTFLKTVGAAGATAALGVAGASMARGSGDRTGPAKNPRARANRLPELAEGLPVAEWVIEENLHPGRTRAWIIDKSVGNPSPAPIEGYLDKVSVAKGEEFTLFVNTVAPRFRAIVFRMGFYEGFGARRIAHSPELPGVRQRPAVFTPGINLVECHWRPSWTTTVTADWPPGNYLIKLYASTGDERYVPFTVRDDSSSAAYVVQNSVTTWQAYNLWGGYSLYGGGKSGQLADRSRLVSFDRPYHNPDAHGSGDWLGNEFPFVYLAERLGLDVTYWTDVDFARAPERLLQHRCLVSLGHDEYWSASMRNGAEAALHKGVNIVFLGANACYRQIRLEASPTGPDRRVICYKDAAEDPMTKVDPALSTGATWATDPVPRPESELVGMMYQSYGASGPLVVADGSSFVFHGTGLSTGDRLSKVIGSEFDAFVPRLSHPPGVELLAHSPTNSVSGPSFSDMSYYTVPGGGGVFATGTASWVTELWDGVGRIPELLDFGIEHHTVASLIKITTNVLAAFGTGPASRSHPSKQTWQHFYRADAPVRPSVDVP